MTRRVEVVGASGRTYGYALLPDGAVAPPQAANLIVAEMKRGHWRIIYVGHTDYMLRNDWRAVIDGIRVETPRAQLLYRLNVAHQVRVAEAEDIAHLHLPAQAQAA